MAYKPAGPITKVNGHSIKPGWFESFSVGTAEQSRQSLQDGWSTPRQQAFNAAHKTCKGCHGRGYTRRNPNIGCHVCGGTGSVPN